MNHTTKHSPHPQDATPVGTGQRPVTPAVAAWISPHQNPQPGRQPRQPGRAPQAETEGEP